MEYICQTLLKCIHLYEIPIGKKLYSKEGNLNSKSSRLNSYHIAIRKLVFRGTLPLFLYKMHGTLAHVDTPSY